MTRTVYIIPAAGVSGDEVRELAPGCRVIEVADYDRATEAAQRHGDSTPCALLGASAHDDLHLLPGLEWVHSSAAGVDAWLGKDILPESVALTSAAGNGAIPLAEHALMLMMMLTRDAPRWMTAQREHRWDRFTHGELTDMRLGIIGYGNSGQDLAEKALACHMHVQALRREPSGNADGPVELLYGESGLDRLLETSDIVVVTAPVTQQTRGMLGQEQLLRMRPGSFVVVVSRGGIVDEEALINALNEGHLGGAGLDAHAVEPLPTESLLWDMPNVIITPHNAATTHKTAERGRTIMLSNVKRWASGLPLVNVVDVSRGY